MSNAYFAFRQFTVRQDRCAMKVSTDACIFGAWIPLPPTDHLRVLDIGTGTGLLALMLAQRHDTAQIDALEIDPAAAGQAAANVADSLFAGRIRVAAQDARLFERTGGAYDLIVSNPPFFSQSLKGPDAARNRARHAEALNLDDLFRIVDRHLHPQGTFALLMPADAAGAIGQAATAYRLYESACLRIQNNGASRPIRGCWLFQRGASPEPLQETLVIRDSERYSPGFRLLLDSYYLLF